MTGHMDRTEWFRQDRFGMFIHWGLYSVIGRGEWVMSHDRISAGEYQKYIEMFNPDEFDPVKWVKTAKRAGMKYVVMTAKHHDGFCLFDSAHTHFKSTSAPFGRDAVREFLDAARAEGLKAGLYFSLIDWSHPDYPKYGDQFHPMRGDGRYKNDKYDFARYLDFMHAQIDELLANYVRLDIMWFDFSYGDLRGEAWRAKEIVEKARRLHPGIILDNRLETSGEGFGSLVTGTPSEWSGDFVSPEQLIPPEGVVNSAGESVPWELCVTVNNNWGYNFEDKAYKTASLLIRKLVECVSKNGNMLLNIGPDGRGRIDSASEAVLLEMGDWLELNGNSIYGCGSAGIPKPEWGRYTMKKGRLYAHVMETPIGPLALTGVEGKRVKWMRRLSDGTAVQKTDAWITKPYGDVLFASLSHTPQYTFELPDERDTVIEINIDGLGDL